ncbi:MAG: tRNA (adenosine(37)-N6)-dimethylallyltransferase MiaA [Patescibacteria group bacterium]
MSTHQVIVIVGPTASGKSALAVSLARALDGEIVSADSRQVYRNLDIGTGKIRPEEMQGIPHHLIDIAEPASQYTVNDYTRDARVAIEGIQKRGKLPIVCGGTGYYIDALIDGISIPEVPPNPELRTRLTEKTTIELYEMLCTKDPRRAANIDPNNPRRLVRALEIAEALGAVPEARLTKTPYEPLFIGISLPPEELKKKIEKRLGERLLEGMIEEVQGLHDTVGLSWERLDLFGLEYRFIAQYLQGILTKAEMQKELFLAICDYAKKQRTWFRRNKRIHWVQSPEEASLVVKQAGL